MSAPKKRRITLRTVHTEPSSTSITINLHDLQQEEHKRWESDAKLAVSIYHLYIVGLVQPFRHFCVNLEIPAQLHVQMFALQGLPKGLSIKEAALAALQKASYMPLREPEDVAKLEACRKEVNL